MYALHLSGLPIMLLLVPESRLLVLVIMLIVSVVELVHLVGCTMRVVPHKLLRLVELFGLEDLLLGRVGGVGQDGLQVVLLYCGL